MDLTFWVRRLWGLLRFLLRQTPHPGLLRHTEVRLDPVAVHRSANAGETFALPIAGRQVDVRVTASPVEDPQTVILVDGVEEEEQRLPQAVSFIGSVVHEDDSDVRLTITPKTMTGSVRIGADQYWIDPLRQFRHAADPWQFVVYRSNDVVFRAPLNDDVRHGGFEPLGGGNRSVNPRVPISVWSDVAFESQAAIVGLEWWEAQSALINNINGFYQPKVGIEFVIRVHVLHRGTLLSSKDPGTLLDEFGACVRRVHGDIRQLSVRQRNNIELAHLLTGRNLKGRTIGIAWQPGVWALSEAHYFRLWGLSFPSPKNTLTVGHELGHNFTGDHDLAEKICVSRFIICLDNERTIMWPTIYSDNRKEFSAQNDNRVTSNAQSGRGVNYTHP